MKIVLLGYMASGKSAVGKYLATSLKIKFLDLDAYIEDCEKISISTIFKTKGEIYFRKKESEYLQQLLNLNESCIISLGGGTPCYGNNMELIKEKSKSFYLNASINTIFNRLQGETSQRPLVATIGKDNLKEYIGKHLFERSLFYNKADEIISVNDKNIDTIAKEIAHLL
ncbi:shikimate kinase [Lutibacter sp. A80]|uniref:shikimate kinase n=1 Tax=Lutibacter sp. A80 TaxID=2918453 RepID=UPI001F05FE70|nr:shikimate kinase [Lutibacter sp. A80]UMB61078.1 shikimate kinase [Lutibacter sp. A80]